MKGRAIFERATTETTLRVAIDLRGTGALEVDSGIRFLDHMLENLARHAGWDLELECRGDLDIDDHHSAEDCAIALGRALYDASTPVVGVRRFASALAPLDEALARVVLDLSGRPHAEIDLGLRRERLGDLSCENVEHFFRTLAMEARLTLHVDVLRGRNDHHRCEAAFKALALALREALEPWGDRDRVPSTKGVLE